jgi:hypothetical protein
LYEGPRELILLERWAPGIDIAVSLSGGQDILLATPSNEDREIASAVLLALSRSLCEVTFMLSPETREKLRRSQAEMSPPF